MGWKSSLESVELRMLRSRCGFRPKVVAIVATSVRGSLVGNCVGLVGYRQVQDDMIWIDLARPGCQEWWQMSFLVVTRKGES